MTQQEKNIERAKWLAAKVVAINSTDKAFIQFGGIALQITDMGILENLCNKMIDFYSQD